jgi:hypothetical protein
MKRKIEGQIRLHIMNTHRRMPSTFMMWTVCDMLADLLLSAFRTVNVNKTNQ